MERTSTYKGVLEKTAVLHPLTEYIWTADGNINSMSRELSKNNWLNYYSCGRLLACWNKAGRVAQAGIDDWNMFAGQNQDKSFLTSWPYQGGILAHTPTWTPFLSLSCQRRYFCWQISSHNRNGDSSCGSRPYKTISVYIVKRQGNNPG